MWELIRQNRRKSILLFVLMGACLVLLGFFIGAAVGPPEGGFVGAGLALVIWLVWSMVGYFAGDSILLFSSGAQEVSHDVHPQLFNVVEEMKIAAALPFMPKVYIMTEGAPNAFAVGRKPEKSAIAVTTGLLSQLNRDELQGVVAHEMSHLKNRDVLFMSFAGIMLGSIVMIAEGFLRGLWYSGGSSRRFGSGGSKGGGQAQLIFLLAALVFAILAPILVQLLYFALSRRREYLADATAVRFTRYPEGLASALEKISSTKESLPRATRATAPMYIVNPLKKKGKALSDMTSTHPPISERIKILRAMSHGAGLTDYQQAFDRVQGKKAGLIPASGLEDSAAIPIRAALSATEGAADPKKSKRDLNDLMRAVNRYAFLACAACGLRIKTPPDLKKKAFPCPRCRAEVHVPAAGLAAAAAVMEALKPGVEHEGTPAGVTSRQVYRRKGKEWETFSCECGRNVNISPIFKGNRITCPGCSKIIQVKN